MASCIKSLLLGCSHSDLIKIPLKTATRGSIFAIGIHKKNKCHKNQDRRGPFQEPWLNEWNIYGTLLGFNLTSSIFIFNISLLFLTVFDFYQFSTAYNIIKLVYAVQLEPFKRWRTLLSMWQLQLMQLSNQPQLKPLKLKSYQFSYIYLSWTKTGFFKTARISNLKNDWRY